MIVPGMVSPWSGGWATLTVLESAIVICCDWKAWSLWTACLLVEGQKVMDHQRPNPLWTMALSLLSD